MNTLTKVTVAALLAGLSLGSAASAHAQGLGFSGMLPDVGALTAEVGKAIASDLTSYLGKAVKAPRATRTRQSPSVSIEAIETVMVVATRLPAKESLQQDVTRTAQVRL
jgi:hypothetical protein